MKMEKTILLHGAAALATVVLYKLLGGQDVKHVAAVVCMYLWWLVTLAAVEERMKERREKRYGRHERNTAGSSRTESKVS